MTNHTGAFLVMMDMLAGRDAGAQERNEDLAFHALQMAQNPGPGLAARVFGWVSSVIAPRGVIWGTQGLNGHMMRDMGLDMPYAAPVNTEVQGSAVLRPVALGGRLAVSF